MQARAASLILAGFVEGEGGTATLAGDHSRLVSLRGVAGGRPFTIHVAGAKPGEGVYRWTISVPSEILADDLDITIIGAIKTTPMVCTYIFMPRVFLRMLGTRHGANVWIGLTVNPFKGGFVTDSHAWPIIEGTSARFPLEPTPTPTTRTCTTSQHFDHSGAQAYVMARCIDRHTSRRFGAAECSSFLETTRWIPIGANLTAGPI